MCGDRSITGARRRGSYCSVFYSAESIGIDAMRGDSVPADRVVGRLMGLRWIFNFDGDN